MQKMKNKQKCTKTKKCKNLLWQGSLKIIINFFHRISKYTLCKLDIFLQV